MLFVPGNLQEWTLGSRMWMAALITVIATLCLSCYFSFVLLEEKKNQCIEVHLSTVSLQFLWVWILVFTRDRILKLDGSSMAIPLVWKFRMLQVPFGGFHVHFAHGWTGGDRNLPWCFSSNTHMSKPLLELSIPIQNPYWPCPWREKPLFPQNLNTALNNDLKRLFLIAVISSIKRITIFRFFLLLCFSSCLRR